MSQRHEMLTVTAPDALRWEMSGGSVCNLCYHYALNLRIVGFHSQTCVHLIVPKLEKQFAVAIISFPANSVHLDRHVVRLAIHEAALRDCGYAPVHGITTSPRFSVVA